MSQKTCLRTYASSPRIFGARAPKKAAENGPPPHLCGSGLFSLQRKVEKKAMKKRIVCFALLLGLLLAGCGTKSPAPAPQPDPSPDAGTWPLTVTDGLDREVTLASPPQRVAVLNASYAETWLLAGGTLVAAVHDAWEDFDLNLGPEVRDLGSGQKVSMELLFETEADLVIASSNTKSQVELRETLEQAGMPVLYFTVNTFEDYLSMLSVCCAVTGRQDLYKQNGLEVQDQIAAAVSAAEKAVAEKGAPTVLLLRTAASGIHAKGSKGTVLGVMLADLGCVNVADGSDLLEDLSIERIIEADPEHVFIVVQGNDAAGAEKTLEDALTGNPAWAGLTAVKEGRMHYMDRKLYHFKPNNRWGIAYAELEALLYEG